jgi:flavin-dependent dehydrogenase
MNSQYDIAILGGGLAGLTSAIHLKKEGFKVIVIEKNTYPKHKVCGEYISNEVWIYLNEIGIKLDSLQPAKIDTLHFSLKSGNEIEMKLPMGGFGISRYSLDFYLYNVAQSLGVIIIQDTVQEVVFDSDTFKILTKNNKIVANVALGAFGKRSNLDIHLNRKFIKKKSNWVGIKAHYKVDFPKNIVGLYHFNGGYCGVSQIENNVVNICYLANYKEFKKYRDIEEFQENSIKQNHQLKTIFNNATLVMEKPLTISQISFNKKETVTNHILMIGDTAGLIHPLCGNGMAMAIHSAKLAADEVTKFLLKRINRKELEQNYTANWKKNFKTRLAFGRILSSIIKKEKIAAIALGIAIRFPIILRFIISKTHGKTI